MSEQEKLVGQMVKAKREAVLMSQAELASALRSRGTKWSQATVWSVESGERPLRLTEASLIADVCGFDPTEFFQNSKPSNDVEAGLSLAIRTLQSLMKDKK